MMRSLLIIVAVAAALGLGYFVGGRHAGPAGDGASVSEPAPEAKVQYTCSMHPFIIRDAPGLCPICGMELTPIKPNTGAAPPQGGEGAPGQIVIDSVTAQNMGIRTVAVERRNLSRTIRTIGLVTYEEQSQYSVNSKIEGWIDRLHINQTGQMVKKGQPLMEIYSPDLVAAQQEYLLALETSSRLAGSTSGVTAAGAGRLLDAARTRLKYWDISDQQIKELEKSRQVRKTLTLYSPYQGIVTEKPVVEGMRVMSGKELLQISDISKVWVNADIYEYEQAWIKVGLPATVEFSFAPGKPLPGKITYIYPYVEGETRTIKARIELANPGLELKPDMYANVSIEAGAIASVLAIPGNAVLNSGKGQTVFVALGEGRFAPRQVKTGVSDEEGYVQILEGLQEGEQVVTSAQFMLDSESKLREAIQKMTKPEGEDSAPAGAAPATETPGADKENLEDLFK
jgi:Cu(I)/Ag(I) efflux system membrane fusion protein/cobalt-zinc-cadmium efflux system membrane fusion protein